MLFCHLEVIWNNKAGSTREVVIPSFPYEEGGILYGEATLLGKEMVWEHCYRVCPC